MPIILGLFLIVIGLSNMKGNISSLHSYHRKRVKEEDVVPFGRLVGIGTILCGISVIVIGCTNLFIDSTDSIVALLGNGIAVVGIIIGIGFNIYAMFKYNKGIF